jgi:hypothetical protein
MEKKFGSRSNMCMLLGYVHDTTKIWRIWDFNSGRNGRAVECSSVIFQEEENAFGKGKGEQADTIEFPEQAEKIHVIEDSPNPPGKSKRKASLYPSPYPYQDSEEKIPEEYSEEKMPEEYSEEKIHEE